MFRCFDSRTCSLQHQFGLLCMLICLSLSNSPPFPASFATILLDSAPFQCAGKVASNINEVRWKGSLVRVASAVREIDWIWWKFENQIEPQISQSGSGKRCRKRGRGNIIRRHCCCCRCAASPISASIPNSPFTFSFSSTLFQIEASCFGYCSGDKLTDCLSHRFSFLSHNWCH